MQTTEVAVVEGGSIVSNVVVVSVTTLVTVVVEAWLTSFVVLNWEMVGIGVVFTVFVDSFVTISVIVEVGGVLGKGEVVFVTSSVVVSTSMVLEAVLLIKASKRKKNHLF